MMLCLSATTVPGRAYGWGWSQARGAHYLKVWDRSLLGNRAYFSDGTARYVGAFGDHALNYYFEYGATDRWTFVTFGRPVGLATFSGNTRVYVGDLNVGLRRGLVQGVWNLAVEAHYGYAPPVGETALGRGVTEGQPFEYTPTIEMHRLEAELQLGRGLWRGGWVSAQAGFRWWVREGVGPAVYGGVQVGHQFGFGLTVSGTVLAHQPLNAVTITNIPGTGQTRYVGFAIDLSYWFTPRWSITAGIGGAPFAQSNAAAIPILVGFEHRG